MYLAPNHFNYSQSGFRADRQTPCLGGCDVRMRVCVSMCACVLCVCVRVCVSISLCVCVRLYACHGECVHAYVRVPCLGVRF